jgi:phosphate transport system ATP-binding protein
MAAVAETLTGTADLAAEEIRVRYGEAEVLHGVSLSWRRGRVGGLVGPSGCGKTTLLRTLNRLVELTPSARVEGRVLLGGLDTFGEPPAVVRRRVGMVFQRPNPFPLSIFENIAYAIRPEASRRPRRRAVEEPVEQTLRRAALWDEVKDSLDRSALRLSGGQQQRLCIARALAAGPDMLLMDEPCASLDPISTAKVEELVLALRHELGVVIVTHNLAQAHRVSDRVAFMLDGRVVEEGETAQVFENPQEQETRDYVAGVFG